MRYRGEVYGNWAILPGEFLEEEAEVRGISRDQLAKRVGLESNVLDELLRGDRAFTAEFVLALEKALPGTKAKVWLTLDARFQMTKVLIAEREREQSEVAKPDLEATTAPAPGSWLSRSPAGQPTPGLTS